MIRDLLNCASWKLPQAIGREVKSQGEASTLECSKDSSSKRPGSDWSICSSFWRDGNLDSSSCAKGTWAHENFCSFEFRWRRLVHPFTLTSPCHWHQTSCYRLVPHGANVCTARRPLLTGRPQVLLSLDIRSLSYPVIKIITSPH